MERKNNKRVSLQDKLIDATKKPLPIHNFSTEIESPKKIEIVTAPRIKSIEQRPKPVQQKKKSQPPPPPNEKVEIKSVQEEQDVYSLGDIAISGRIQMAHLGIDVGTKTVVLAFRNEEKVNYISEINGYWPFERATPFIEKLLNDPNKIRSDGTKRPARWIRIPDAEQILVLGKDAEEFAYAKNDTLLRPMADGGVAAEDESMTVLSAIIQGLIETAEKDVGKFEKEIKISYCTTANALNSDSVNIDYHERVVSAIISNYKTNANIILVGPDTNRPGAIKESHAIVLDMDEGDGTGIGISWGAGTVTVSYVKYGMEIYSFCWVGAGDWIDNEVAKRHGYNPDIRRKKSKETPTTVSRRKEHIDLTPGVTQPDRLMTDISLHYNVLINKAIEGIVDGFNENENEARIDDTINVYMAGGTSSPSGFAERVSEKFDERDLPFEIATVKTSGRPLFAVASGCLKAAEMF